MAVGRNPAESDVVRREAAAAIEQVITAYESSPELLEEIFDIFTEDAPERLAALRQAATGADYAQARRAAHSLANTTGTLQCESALEAARHAEAAARSADAAALVDATAELSCAVDAMLAAIEAHRNAGR